MNLRIGLTFGYNHPGSKLAETNRERTNEYKLKKRYSTIEHDMVEWVCQEGVIPSFIPHLENECLLNKMVGELDGLVLTGGVDMDPTCYGEKHINYGRWPGDIYRDQYELRVLKKAYELHIPILGICRGCQLLNVFFGGTLYQDLVTQLETDEKHRNDELYDRIDHPVKIESGGELEKIYSERSNTYQVNTVHHQGIKELGKNLRVEAVSPKDNLVEAFSLASSTHFVMAVQWHPEFAHTLGDKIMSSTPLWNYYYEKCLEYNKRRSV